MEKKNKINKKDIINRKTKDTVFTDLFRNKKYLLQLYQDLHPEDLDTRQEDLQIITLENILVHSMYNDLGFIAKDKLLILVEAQSTQSVNIALRMLLYLSQTVKDYLQENGLNVHSKKQIILPTPEFYVIYTGEDKKGNRTIKLSDTYKEKQDLPQLELTINIIETSYQHKIIWQYIEFCRILNEQAKKYGYTKEMIEETIKICTDEDILKEYLSKRKKEVMSIMSTLFSQEEVTKFVIEEEREEAKKEGKEEGRKEGMQKGMQKERVGIAQRLLKLNISIDDIIKATGLDKETINTLL